MFDSNDTFSSFAVKDLDAAKKFYGETLGLTTEDDTKMGLLHINLKSGAKLMVYPKPDHQPATYTILNFLVDDLEKAVDTLTAAGVVFEHYDNEYVKTNDKGIAEDGQGPRIAWFTDPSKNILSVIEKK